MKRRVAGALVCAAAVVAVFATGAQGVPTGAKVRVTDFEFSQPEVTVKKGEKVVWAFKEGKHNVTGKGFKSDDLKQGTFKHVFDNVGTFKYRCTLHQPDMDGVIKVTR